MSEQSDVVRFVVSAIVLALVSVGYFFTGDSDFVHLTLSIAYFFEILTHLKRSGF